MRFAWEELRHVFSVRKQGETVPNATTGSGPQIFYGHHRYSLDLLNKNPVDLLVVDQGTNTQPPNQYSRNPWEEVVEASTPPNKPKVVVEAWPATAQLWSKGPMNKACVTRWQKQGYTSHCKLVRATEVGGAIRQIRLIIARVAKNRNWNWDCIDRDPDLIRPMSNLLTPPGLVSRRLYQPQHRDSMVPRIFYFQPWCLSNLDKKTTFPSQFYMGREKQQDWHGRFGLKQPKLCRSMGKN